MTNRINKYLYGYKIYVNYGYGYEYECFELTQRDMVKQVKKYYKENCYPIKVTHGRELNPDYITNHVHVAGYSHPI